MFPNTLLSLYHSCFPPDTLSLSLHSKIKTCLSLVCCQWLHKEVEATPMKGWACTCVSQSPCFSSALHDSREQMFGDSLHAHQKKKICVQSKQQHSALLGSGNVDVWEEGKRQERRRRLLWRGNCVREVETVSRLQYMRFCHSNEGLKILGYCVLCCLWWAHLLFSITAQTEDGLLLDSGSGVDLHSTLLPTLVV